MGCLKLEYHPRPGRALEKSPLSFFGSNQKGRESEKSPLSFFGSNQKGRESEKGLDYFTGGSVLPGRAFNAGSYRYGFNGQEQDDEIKGTGNSLDFGDRVYDSRLCRWLSIDPLAAKFPFESNYVYTSNNPILYVDIDGKYKWPASKRKEYTAKYPMITKYLAENVKSDVLSSAKIVLALERHTRSDTDPNYPNNQGNLTQDKVMETVTWNSGPEILVRDKPGGMAGASGYFNIGTKQIELNEDMLNKVEGILAGDGTEEEKQSALFEFYTTLLHETVHEGDYKDGILNEGEPGYDFTDDVWGEEIQINDNETIKYNGSLHDDENRQKVIDRAKETEDGKKTLPTVPD